MKILLIGNFAPPYEDENLHNLSLLNKLREEGNDCCVINSSKIPSKEKGFIDSKNFLDFVFKVIRHGYRKDIIHCFTKGYTRAELLKFIVSTIVGRFFRAKPVLTLHSEMFAVIGKTRSYLLGTPALRISFFLAHKIICGDKDTYETAAVYKTRNNFEIIPLFIHIPKNIKENESLALEKLKNKKRVIIFANIGYPSFAFEILNKLLSKYPVNPDIGIVVSLSERPSAKLQHVIEETGKRISENLVFIEPDDMRLLSTVYSRANFVIRSLRCEGNLFFSNFVISARKPVRSANYLYFPTGLLFVKEGETADLCACIINDFLWENPEEPTHLKIEDDFYDKIKNIYLEP